MASSHLASYLLKETTLVVKYDPQTKESQRILFAWFITFCFVLNLMIWFQMKSLKG